MKKIKKEQVSSKGHVDWVVFLGKFVPLIRVDADHVDHDNWQHKLHYILDSHTTHVTCIVLLICDLLLILVEYGMYIHMIQSKLTKIKENMETFCNMKSNTYDYSKCSIPPDSEEGEKTIFIIELISIVILSLFFIECAGHIVAKGSEYFTDVQGNWFHWLDFAVIIVSLYLELKTSSGSGTSLIIFARFWRLIRVAETVVEIELNTSHQSPEHEDIESGHTE